MRGMEAMRRMEVLAGARAGMRGERTVPFGVVLVQSGRGTWERSAGGTGGAPVVTMGNSGPAGKIQRVANDRFSGFRLETVGANPTKKLQRSASFTLHGSGFQTESFAHGELRIFWVSCSTRQPGRSNLIRNCIKNSFVARVRVPVAHAAFETYAQTHVHNST